MGNQPATARHRGTLRRARLPGALRSPGPIDLGCVFLMATLRFLGTLRQAAGMDALDVEAPTVADALGKATGRLGAGFAVALFPGGELDSDIEILVNGRNIGFSGGLGTRLNPSDEVALFRHGARGYPGG